MDTKLTVHRNTGLAKVEKPLAPELSKKESEIVRASRTLFCYRLIEQADPEINFILLKALNQFATRTGFQKQGKVEDNEQEEIIMGLLEAVKLNRWLKVKELELILSRGMLGEFGDFHGLNGRTLNGWIKTYFERERAEALKKQIKFEQEQAELANKASKEEAARVYTIQQRKRFVDAYNRLKNENTGPVTWASIPAGIDTGNIWYERFWKSGLHRVDRPTYDQYVSEAEKRFRVDELAKHLDNEGRKRRAEAYARGRVLREKIAELINADQDIEEVLNFVGL